MQTRRIWFVGLRQGLRVWKTRRFIEQHRRGEDEGFRLQRRLRRTRIPGRADVLFARNRPERTADPDLAALTHFVDRLDDGTRLVINPPRHFSDQRSQRRCARVQIFREADHRRARHSRIQSLSMRSREPEADQQRSRSFSGWTNAVLLFFIYGAVYGFVFYGFTVIFPEMIRAQGWGRGDAAVAHTLRAFSLGAFAPLVAIAVGRAGAKRTMIAGLFVGVIALGMLGTVTSQLWQWIVLWGILMPVAFSFGGAIPIQTTLMHWFNVRRATALGIVLSSVAFGGFVAAPLYTLIMRETGTWKAGWLAAGTFCALALVASLFMRNKPADIGQFPDGVDPESVSDTPGSVTAKKARTYRTSETWELREVLRQPVLYLLGICMVSQLSAVYLLTTHGVLHLTDVGFTRMQSAAAIGNLVLFSGLARFPIGFIGDRIEPRRIMTVALAGMGLALVGIWKVSGELWVLLAIVSLFGLCFGSLVPLFPALIGNYFGPSVFAKITGFLSPVMILVSAPVPVMAGMIYDRFHSYDIAFIYVVSLTLVASLLTSALVPPKKANPS